MGCSWAAPLAEAICIASGVRNAPTNRHKFAKGTDKRTPPEQVPRHPPKS